MYTMFIIVGLLLALSPLTLGSNRAVRFLNLGINMDLSSLALGSKTIDKWYSTGYAGKSVYW